jgi:hypothetical protein
MTSKVICIRYVCYIPSSAFFISRSSAISFCINTVFQKHLLNKVGQSDSTNDID